ncbi:ester hydrolase C11orf54 homolog [Ooceraea biroi]|nr:ester hydrolase C11orf54 homolog [Ooceraea biroi]
MDEDYNAAVPEEWAALPDEKESTIFDLQVPDPRTVVDVMNRRLRTDFREVTVDWIACPDLRRFGFVAPGLCGNPALFELGSLSYLLPTPRPNKTYNFRNLLGQFKLTNRHNFIIGAGKHSDPRYYDISELYANFMFSPASPTDGSMEIENDSFAVWRLRNYDWSRTLYDINPTCEIQGNFFLSEGRLGRVFKVTAHYPTGTLDFVSAIQILLPLMKNEGDPRMIGLGGIIFLNDNIPTLHHVTPSCYSLSNLHTMNQVQEWLQYKTTLEPVTAIGTIMSEGGYYKNLCPSSTENPYITKSHFHSRMPSGSGGHLYTDFVDNNYSDAYYVGFFSFAEKLYCVDPPSHQDIRTTIQEFDRPF